MKPEAMTSTRIPKHTCWACGYNMDRTSPALGKEMPKHGDVSLCMRCGEAMIFDHDLSLRSPTEEERMEINADPIVAKCRAAIRYRRSG